MNDNNIYELLPLGVLRLNRNLCVDWVSSKFETLFDIKEDQLLGKNVDQLLSPGDSKGQIKFYGQLLQYNGGILDCQIAIRPGVKDYLVRIRATRQEADWYIFFEDLLNDNESTFHLLWEEKKFSNIVKLSGEGIVMLNTDFQILEFNRKFFDLMNFKSDHGIKLSEAALEGKPFFELAGEEFVGLKYILQNTHLRHTSSYTEIISFKGRYLEVQHSPTIVPVKGVTGHCIVFKDITTQKQLESLTLELNRHKAELEVRLKKNEEQALHLNRVNKEKNDLVHIMAHDLRSPLNQIQGLLQLIKLDANPLSDEQEKHLERIYTSLQRYSTLIEKTLNGQFMGDEKDNIQLEPVDLAEVLETVVENNKEIALRKGIKLKLATKKTDSILLDEKYVYQIFENLISNAIKFSDSGSSVEIKLYNTNKCIRTEISDQGQGFSQKELDVLFKDFRKFSARPTNGESSFGLGLSIVKRYLDYFNADIFCESEKGKGARFVIDFLPDWNNAHVAL